MKADNTATLYSKCFQFERDASNYKTPQHLDLVTLLTRELSVMFDPYKKSIITIYIILGITL